MELRTKVFETYRFDELSKEVQGKVLGDNAEFFLDFIPFDQLSKEMKQAINMAEKMRTPWFTLSYMVDYAKDELIKFSSQFMYLENGEVFY